MAVQAGTEWSGPLHRRGLPARTSAVCPSPCAPAHIHAIRHKAPMSRPLVPALNFIASLSSPSPSPSVSNVSQSELESSSGSRSTGKGANALSHTVSPAEGATVVFKTPRAASVASAVRGVATDPFGRTAPTATAASGPDHSGPDHPQPGYRTGPATVRQPSDDVAQMPASGGCRGEHHPHPAA